MAIDGKPNVVLMPDLDCFPNGPAWTNFANFRLFFNKQALGYFGLVLRYHFCCKLEKNLATLMVKPITDIRNCKDIGTKHCSSRNSKEVWMRGKVRCSKIPNLKKDHN